MSSTALLSTAEAPVLFDLIVDDLPFPAGQPAGQDHQQQLEGGGVDHGPAYITSLAGRRRLRNGTLRDASGWRPWPSRSLVVIQ
jgi:hypothetical protein